MRFVSNLDPYPLDGPAWGCVVAASNDGHPFQTNHRGALKVRLNSGIDEEPTPISALSQGPPGTADVDNPGAFQREV